MRSFSLTEINLVFSKLYYEHIHERLSSKIKKISSEIFYFIKLQLLVRLGNLRLQVYTLNGNNELNILYMGNKTSLEYLSNLLFTDEPKIEFLGEIFVWNIYKKINQYHQSFDIILLKTDRFFQRYLQKRGFIILPEWVESRLKISVPLEIFLKNLKESARDDIARKIKRYGFTYEITSDPQKFKLFYDSIYLPFILNRHPKMALPDAIDYLEIKSMFEKGKLLLVKEKEEIVSGSIFYTTIKTANLLYVGVKIEPDYLAKGAGGAIYYFFINWAKKQGFNLLKFGGVRPFLKDGLFQYKRKWGSNIKISRDMYGIFGFKFCKNNLNQLVEFIKKNPFIYIEKDKLKAIIFLSEIPSVRKVQEIWKTYYTPDIAELLIISEKDLDQEVKNFIKNNFNGKVSIKNISSLKNNQLFF